MFMNYDQTPGKTEEYSEDAPPAEGGHQGGDRQDTFYLPKDMLGGKEWKAGETIMLKVVGHTSDGKVEVEHVKPKEQLSLEDDFDKSMGPDGQGPAEPPATEGGTPETGE